MSRDDLVKAMSRAADPTRDHWWMDEAMERALERVEPIIRADERDQVHATIQAGEIPASLYEEMVYDAFTDLRAKVLGLLTWNMGSEPAVNRDDVLALLKEKP